jgi:hypothetical protein
MFHDSITVPYLLVFCNIINLFFKILMLWSSADFQWLISAEGEMT